MFARGVFASLLMVGFWAIAAPLPNVPAPSVEMIAAKCVGADPCMACKNCSSCKHCKGGGSCGACKKKKSDTKSALAFVAEPGCTLQP